VAGAGEDELTSISNNYGDQEIKNNMISNSRPQQNDENKHDR